MKLVLSGMAMVAAPLLAGCGGRAHLDETAGAAYDRVWQAQAYARPSQAVAPLTADDARIIVDNHGATFRMEGASSSKSGDSGGGMAFTGAGGLLTPLTQTFGDDGAYGADFNPRPIKLQAK